MTRSASTRSLAVVLVLVLAAWAAAALVSGDDETRPSAVLPEAGGEDPFAYDPDRREEFERRAAAGLAHVLYAKSPGGAIQSAARVARYRDLIEDAAGDHDPDVIEGMVLLESAGRPDAMAGSTEGAVGLTQILAETGANLLRMRVDVAASRRLTRQIARAARRGDGARTARLQAERRRVDERYDPPKALAATVRYLDFASDQLDGRDDMAVASYHMGVGNLQSVLEAFGADDDTPYAEVFFDSSPLRHEEAWGLLARLGDDSSTYLWRVRAAQEIMRLYREDPDELARLSELHGNKNSAEEVLHRPDDTEVFAEPQAIETARDEGELVGLPADRLRAAGIRVDRRMGELAERQSVDASLYRALRPEALALLVYLGDAVKAISRSEPLVLTSTVRDLGYQQLLTRRNSEATHGYSLHTTGWAFDVERRYASREQALAFQFMLDRLQALNLVAWVREPAAIHVTVGGDAKALLEE
ncbi:MAG TPA: transglycosylase SLT domain-containing protein [Solirubrobacteraceae bacterium]|nr:transglycosylase SLT domain-containing protein [Solirubrobacteraceae bacterium]